MTNYLDLCCLLGASSLRQGASATDLSTRIDFTLGTFHIKLEQHTTRARSTLADIQNKIMSPIYRVPREILSEIFAYVVYTPDIPADQFHTSMAASLINNYRAVYRLLGVCSAWRTITLARRSFWSMVPIVKPIITLRPSFVTRHPCSTLLSLERAGAGDLHLAVVLPDLATDVVNDLTRFAPRFRTINIMCKAHSVIRHILDYFRDYGSSSRLTDLSVFFESREFNNIPQENDYVFPSSDPKRQLFERLVKSLSILRVRGAVFHLHTALSSSRLVELHLQELTLGRDSKFAELLVVLSSVSGLRHLRLVSIKTFPENELIPITIISLSISLPGLQTLFIQDLYANTLHLLLSLISSRTHHITLYLTEKCSQVQHPGEPHPDMIGTQGLVGLPGFSCVNVLMVNWMLKCSMSAENFRKVVTSMPNLETLHMIAWHFDREYCEAMTRPQNSDLCSFPRLKNIHIYSASIHNTNSFTIMVASHSESLEWMVLGGGIEKNTYDGELEWESLEEEDEVVIWLDRNVRKFELINYGYEPPESQEKPEWQLW